MQRFFQEGGLIGFSVGHKYKISQPDDHRASLYGGGFEADCTEKILEKVQMILEEVVHPPEEREIRVVCGNEVLWRQVVDPEAEVI
jgi:hypothetical protein